MAKIGIFYGSDTGHTEEAAQLMQDLLGTDQTDLFDVRNVTDTSIISKYDLIIIGTSTWYLGEIQEDMDDFKTKLDDVDFSGKTIALFGLGDQEQYGDYYLDGMGKMHEFLKAKGAKFIGSWPVDEYKFASTLSLVDDGKKFCGLALDEDNQPDMTPDRIALWIEQIKKEANIKE